VIRGGHSLRWAAVPEKKNNIKHTRILTTHKLLSFLYNPLSTEAEIFMVQ
jgi:hypothetical protein